MCKRFKNNYNNLKNSCSITNIVHNKFYLPKNNLDQCHYFTRDGCPENEHLLQLVKSVNDS